MLNGYRKSLADATTRARSGATFEMPTAILAVYGFSLAWLAVWASVGPGSRWAHHYFGEGGPIDWLSAVYLATAALLAWIAWAHGSRRPAEPAPWFWLLAALGLSFLAVDERFQLHEHILSDWQEPLFGPVPFGLRNWNDLVVIVYGLIGIAVFLVALPAVLRYRSVRILLFAGFAFFAVHTFLDAADRLFSWDSLKEMGEEGSKLLSGATLMLAFLQATICRYETRASPWTGARFAAIFAAITLGAAALLIGGDAEWQATLRYHWGNPPAWLAATYLGVAAMFTALRPLALGAATRGTKWFDWSATAFQAILAFDLATVACGARFSAVVVRGKLPWVLADVTSIVQRPVQLVVFLIVAAVTMLATGGFRAHRGSQSSVLYLGALVMLGALVVFSAMNTYVPSVMSMMLGSMALVLCAFGRFTEGLADRADPSRCAA